MHKKHGEICITFRTSMLARFVVAILSTQKLRTRASLKIGRSAENWHQNPVAHECRKIARIVFCIRVLCQDCNLFVRDGIMHAYAQRRNIGKGLLTNFHPCLTSEAPDMSPLGEGYL